jgi:small neutral amino acid transporter SnatA (MarC family)
MGAITFGFSDVNTAAYSLFNIAGGVAGAVFIVMLLVGGVQYLTAMGNEEATTKAKKLLINAVIGILIVALAYAAGWYVLRALNITSPILR